MLSGLPQSVKILRSRETFGYKRIIKVTASQQTIATTTEEDISRWASLIREAQDHVITVTSNCSEREHCEQPVGWTGLGYLVCRLRQMKRAAVHTRRQRTSHKEVHKTLVAQGKSS